MVLRCTCQCWVQLGKRQASKGSWVAVPRLLLVAFPHPSCISFSSIDSHSAFLCGVSILFSLQIRHLMLCLTAIHCSFLGGFASILRIIPPVLISDSDSNSDYALLYTLPSLLCIILVLDSCSRVIHPTIATLGFLIVLRCICCRCWV
jgi:hypothetical protein